jgi:hypothetical protein
LVLRIALWIGDFLSILTVESENVSRVGMRSVSGIRPFPFVGLVSFGGLLLEGLLFHTHLEVIV